MPPPGQTPCCWSAACHGGIRNIYKLKATSCGLFCIRKPCPRIHVRSGMQFPLTAPLGNCIPLRLQIPGRIFHQSPQPETASHSKGKFRDTLSETPSIRKARPTLNTSSERMRVCRPERSRHRGNGKCHPKRLPRLRLQVSRKSLENFEAFTFVLFCTKDRGRRSYSPSTAFLAAAAMLSRSSLVGWSFAATQLSSSILNRALSGSCSSMAS